MKLFPLLLGLSLALNTALVVALKSHDSAVPSSNTQALVSDPKIQPPPVSNGLNDANQSGPRSASQTPLLQWKQIKTDDLQELVHRLYLAGFPAKIVNDIIAMKVNELFTARRNALTGRTGNLEYWKSSQALPSDPKKDSALTALSVEQYKMLHQLLGPGYNLTSEGYVDYMSRLYGDVPPEKLKQIEAIASDYQILGMEALAALSIKGSAATQEDRDKIRLINQQLKKDIVALLSPEELRAMNTRSSFGASTLRNDTRLFRTTESEFLALLPIYESGTQDPGYPDFHPQFTSSPSIQTQIAAVLGPDRYAEYQQARDPEFDKLNRIVERLDLPISTAISLAALQKDTVRQAENIRADTSLSADQRASQIAALANQASAKISGSLGPQGFEAYKRYSARWLQMLMPKTGAPKS